MNFALQHYELTRTDLSVEELSSQQRQWNELASLLNARPQSELDGSVWILKPGRKSRGRGITLHSSLSSVHITARADRSFVVQKYLERPLLIHKRKFDIRLWALITGVKPLQLWVYEKCYIRFSVLDYDLTNLDNRFVHLTNNSVSKDAAEFSDNEIQGCMWSLRKFRKYMEKRFDAGVWTQQISPRVKAIITQTIRAAEASLEAQPRAFELLGFDVLLAEDLSPWLLEVNSSPSLQHSTRVTGRLIPQLLDDLVTVVLDRPDHRAGHFLRLL